MGTAEDFKLVRIGTYLGVGLGGGFGLVLFVLFAIGTGATIVDHHRSGTVPTAAVVILPCIAFMGVVCSAMAFYFLRKGIPWWRLWRSELVSHAAFAGADRSGMRINGTRLYYLRVTVQPGDAPPYPAVGQWIFPSDLRKRLKPGAPVLVRIDPKNDRNVVIDWDLTREAWATPEQPPEGA